MSNEKPKSEIIEIVPLWRRDDGSWKSAVLMDDRVSDLFQVVREKPYTLMLKPVTEKRTERSPDGFLIAVPAKRR